MDLFRKGAVFVFAFSALSAAAAAESARHSAPPPMAVVAGVSFEEADQDDSGFIDAAEAGSLGLDVLPYDVNNDGIVDRDEWARAPESATEAETPERTAPAAASGVTFEEADLDDSGFVDATEAKELGLDVVEYDVNFNGVIDRIEWERAPEEATEPRGAGETQERRY